MLRVGLTGGIACGKSTVAEIFRECGFPVLEADKLAHQMIERGEPAYAGVVVEFGNEILRADGSIDRGKLGEIVFADGAKLARLNELIHPYVLAAQDAILARHERHDVAVAVVEAALLYEAGYDAKLDRMVVCWCRREQQVERLLARGLTQVQAEQRIASQMPLEEKRRRADVQIDCSGTLEHTREQALALAQRLMEISRQQGRGSRAL